MMGTFSSIVFPETAKRLLPEASIDPIDPVNFKSVLSTELTPNINGYNLTYITGAARLGRYSAYRVRYPQGDLRRSYVDLIAFIHLRTQLRIIILHYTYHPRIAITNRKDINSKILQSDPSAGREIEIAQGVSFLPLYKMGFYDKEVIFFGSLTVADHEFDRREEGYYSEAERAFSDLDVQCALGADIVLRSAYAKKDEEYIRIIYNLYSFRNQSNRLR